MKKELLISSLLFFSILLFANKLHSQVPQKFSQQMTVYDSDNDLMAGENISVKIRILQSTPTGSAVYTELHSVTTNENGVAFLDVGTGITDDNFSNINWLDDNYYIETSVDIYGTNDYLISAVNQLLSVPFAINAATAENYDETDPIFNAWDKSTGVTIDESQVTNLRSYLLKSEYDLMFSKLQDIEAPLLANLGFVDSRDDKHYKTVQIGDQVWMAENLRYLPDVHSAEDFSLTEPRYYVHSYEGTDVAEAKAEQNYKTYGVLYNWHAAMQGAEPSNFAPSNVQGICPDGWHLPSYGEWLQLSVFLGEAVAANKLKEEGTAHWSEDLNSQTHTKTTNETGFTALPAGIIDSNAPVPNISIRTTYWSTSKIAQGEAVTIVLTYNEESISVENYTENIGASVRCVRD